VPTNDALEIGQANARALKLVVIVEALEDAEQFLGIVRIETGAVCRPRVGLTAVCGGFEASHS
jgi:hypothetical protein